MQQFTEFLKEALSNPKMADFLTLSAYLAYEQALPGVRTISYSSTSEVPTFTYLKPEKTTPFGRYLPV